MALQLAAIAGTGNAFGSGSTNDWKAFQVTTTDSSTLRVAASNNVHVTWAANATSVTLTPETGSTFPGLISNKGYHFRYNNVNYLFNQTDFTGTGGTRTIAVSALDKYLDTSTASSGDITVHQTDDLDDLATLLGNSAGVDITRSTDTNRHNRVHTLTNTATTGDNIRTLIICRARIVDERSGETELRLDWDGTGGGLFVNLCGGTGAKVTLGKEANNILTGKVKISIVGSFANNGFGSGSITPSDSGYSDGGTLVADTDTSNGYAKYFMSIGLAGSDDWFYTPTVPNCHAYTIVVENGTDGRRFDIGTADEGMTGRVSFSMYGMNDRNDNADARAHITAGSWEPVTGLLVGSSLVESKYRNRTVGSNEVTGVGGGTQNSWNLSRTYGTSIAAELADQTLDFQAFNINNLRANTSLVIYDYPFRRYRALRFGYAHGSTTAYSTHSIILTPDGSKPYGDFIDITRDDHGFHGRGANFLVSMAVTPTYQDTTGSGHDNGWMLYDRTYRNAADSADAGWSITGLQTNATSLTGTNGRLDTQGSSNPDLVHIDSTDSGSSKGNTTYGYYMWEIDGTDNGDKRGGILPYIYSSSNGTGHSGGVIANTKYTGTYDVYFGAPGRPTATRTWQVMDSNDKMVTGSSGVEQDITISHNLFDHLSLDSNGLLEDVQVVELAGESVTNEVMQVSSDHETYTLTGAITSTQLLATVSHIPYLVSTTWSGFTRAEKLETGANGRYSRFKDRTGHFGRISEYNGDYITSASGSKITIKSKASTGERLMISTGSNIPTQVSGEYDTIDISDGNASPVRGEWSIGSNGLDCSSTGNHAYLQGRISSPRTYSSYALANADGAFTINAHDRLNGVLRVAAASDVYIRFTGDCSIESGATFAIQRASGTGTVFVLNPPTSTDTSDGNVTPVRQVTITRPALSGESSVRGRLTLVRDSDNTLIASSTGTLASGTVTYSFDSVTNTALSTNGAHTFVWSGPGGRDHRQTVTVVAGTVTADFTLISQTQASATSYTGNATYTPILVTGITTASANVAENATSFTVAAISGLATNGGSVISGTNRITYTSASGSTLSGVPATGLGRVTGAITSGAMVYESLVIEVGGNQVPTVDELIYLLDTTVRSTEIYNRYVAISSNNVNAVSNDNGEFAQINGTYIDMEISATNPADKTMPYAENTTSNTPTDPITRLRTISSTDYATNIVGSAPVISAALFRDLGVATTEDVTDARDVTADNITGARNVLIGTINGL